MSEPIDDPLTMHEDRPVATTEPDRLLLIGLDGSKLIAESKFRLGPIVHRRDVKCDRIYELRGVDQVDGQWLRIYREVKVDSIAVR